MGGDVKSDVKTLQPATTVPHSVDFVVPFTVSKSLKPFFVVPYLKQVRRIMSFMKEKWGIFRWKKKRED